jgi:SRSO17 transposase
MSRAFSQAKLKGEERRAILQAIETQMQQVIIDRNGTRKGEKMSMVLHREYSLWEQEARYLPAYRRNHQP